MAPMTMCGSGSGVVAERVEKAVAAADVRLCDAQWLDRQ